MLLSLKLQEILASQYFLIKTFCPCAFILHPHYSTIIVLLHNFEICPAKYCKQYDFLCYLVWLVSIMVFVKLIIPPDRKYTPRYKVYGGYTGIMLSTSFCRHFLWKLFLRNQLSEFHETSQELWIPSLVVHAVILFRFGNFGWSYGTLK